MTDPETGDPSGSSPLRGGFNEDPLAEILSRYIDRINSGEAIDERIVREENPEAADTILLEIETFRRMASSQGTEERAVRLGDYRIGRKLGRGGMGVVYEAWQGSMDRRVALKVLPAGVAADSRAVARFIREAQAAGRLHHPAIVPVYGIGVEAETPFYAMEFIEGETLAQVLARRRNQGREPGPPKGPLDTPSVDAPYCFKVAAAFVDVAEGLQHAHQKGVVHRDLKPSNLILDAQGHLRVLDFGLARLEGQDSLTASGDFLGTLQYMSPEQALSRRITIDRRTDIYSLGATLYEVIALRPPFSGRDHQETLSRIIQDDPEPPRRRNALIPRDLETIVLKCLQKSPEDRYRTAEALAQDLRRFSRGDPVEARPYSRWETGARKAWRNRRKILIAAIIAILVVASSVLGLLNYSHRRARDLALYEEVVVRSMLRIEMSALPGAVSARLETNALLPGGIFDMSDFEGVTEDLDLSLEELEAQKRAFPRRPEAYCQRAKVLLAIERTGEAILELERGLRIDPDFLPAQAALEDLGKSLPPRAAGMHPADWREPWARAKESLRRSESAQAVDSLTRLLDGLVLRDAYCGAEIEARLHRAEARLKLKDILAVADLEVVRSRWPSAPEPVLLQGLALHTLGHPEDAEAMFQIVSETFPRKANTILWVAGIYIALSDHDRAERWIECVEGKAVRERLRSLRLRAIGEHSGAIDAARRAVDLEPGNPRNHQILSQLFDLRNTEQQAAVLETAVALFPGNLDLKGDLCQVRFRQGRYEDGCELAREVLRVNPRMAGARDMLGCCLFRLGRVDEALLELEEAARDPRHFPHDLGWANFNLGRLYAAKKAYGAASEMDPRNAWALRLLGMIEARQGHDEEALGFLTRSLEGYPRNGVSHYNLAVFQEERGELQEALRNLAESLRLAVRGMSHWRLLNILRSTETEDLDLSVLDGLASDLERFVARSGSALEKQLLARILLLRGRDSADGLRAMDLARHAFEEARPLYPEVLATLADARFALGEEAAAIRSLEEALLLPHATNGMARQLERWRRELSGAARPDGRGPEARVILAGAARWSGRFGEALAVSLDGLSEFPGEARFLGELALLWGLDPAPVEEGLNRISGSGTQGSGEAGAMASDALAVLRQLAKHQGIRIDCGGDGSIDREGGAWSADAFYHGGWERLVFETDSLTVGDAYEDVGKSAGPRMRSHDFHGPIAGTGDPDLHRSERWFHPSEDRPGYRIPLPPGRYLVRLHFAETWYRAEGLRKFAVLTEGKGVAGGAIEPFLHGFAVAFVEEVETEVDDGLLDVEFRSERGYPTVAAIEVLRKD